MVRLDFYGIKDVFDYALENGYNLVSVYNVISKRRYLVKKTKDRYKVKEVKGGKRDYRVLLGDSTFLHIESVFESLSGCEDLFGSLSPVVKVLRKYLSSHNFSWLSLTFVEMTKEVKKKVAGMEIDISDLFYKEDLKKKMSALPQDVAFDITEDLSRVAWHYPSYVSRSTRAPSSLVGILRNLEDRTYHSNLERQLSSVGGVKKKGPIEKEAYKAINLGRINPYRTEDCVWYSWIWREPRNLEKGWKSYQLSEAFETPLAHIFRIPPRKTRKSGVGWSRDWPLVKSLEYHENLDGRTASLLVSYSGIVPLEPDEEEYVKDYHSVGVLPVGKVGLLVEVDYKGDGAVANGLSVPEYPQAEGLYFRCVSEGTAQVGVMITDLQVISGDPDVGEAEIEVSFAGVSMRRVSVGLARAREDLRRLTKKSSTHTGWPIDPDHTFVIFSKQAPVEGEREVEEYPLNLFFFSSHFFISSPGTSSPDLKGYSVNYYEMSVFDPENSAAFLAGDADILTQPDQALVRREDIPQVIDSVKRAYSEFSFFRHPFFSKLLKSVLITLKNAHRTPTLERGVGKNHVLLSKSLVPINSELCFSLGEERVRVDAGLSTTLMPNDLIHLYGDLEPSEPGAESGAGGTGEEGEGGRSRESGAISVPKSVLKAYSYLYPSHASDSQTPVVGYLARVLNKGKVSFDEVMEACKEIERRGYSITILGNIGYELHLGEREEGVYLDVREPIVIISNRKGYRAFVI